MFAHSAITPAQELIDSRTIKRFIQERSLSVVCSVIILALKLVISRSTSLNILEKSPLFVISAISHPVIKLV